MKNTLKNTSKVFGIIALAALIMISITGCGGENSGGPATTSPVLTGISIKTMPAKLNYHIGDELDSASIKVQADYSDGSSEPVNNKELSYDYDFFAPGKATVVVAWHGKSTFYNVTVDDWALIGLNITHAPSKYIYKDESTLDLTDLEIEAVYENRVEDVGNIEESLGSHILAISGINPAKAGIQTVTVSYGKGAFKVSDTFEIKMYALTGISAVPVKTIYKIGDDFDLEALTVTADYSAGMDDDKHDPITNKKELTISGFTSVKADHIIITVTWKGKKTNFDVAVYILSGIVITHQPTKLKYSIGESLDTTGLEVKAYYTDGIVQHIYDSEPIPVKDLVFVGFDSNTGGSKPVVIKYGGEVTAFNVTIGTLDDIEIISQTKTTYRVGEEIDRATIKVQAINSDDHPEIVEDYTIDAYDHNTRGPKSITIRYKDKTTTLNVTYIAFNVIFSPKGGNWNGSTANRNINANYNVPVDSNPGNPSRKYYEFLGWFKDTDGTTPWNIANNVTEDMTLYAKWELKPFNENADGSVLAEYLKLEGGTVNNPFSLILSRGLGFINGSAGNGWYDLLALINESGKYVDLNLSACTMNGGDFNPIASNPGKAKVVKLVLPDAATVIPHGTEALYAFQDFVNLKSISIGSGITLIGNFAFEHCTKLELVTVNKAIASSTLAPTLGLNAFLDDHPSLQIKVPEASVGFYKDASGWKNYAGKISGI